MQIENSGTFNDFVALKENRFALTVANEVAIFSKSLPSVVFLVGRSGTGKTHLLRAVENTVKKNHATNE